MSTETPERATAEPMTAEQVEACRVHILRELSYGEPGRLGSDESLAMIAGYQGMRAALERLIPEAHDLDSTKCRERATRQEALSPCQQRPAEWDDDCPACDAQAALSSSPSGEQS